MKVKTKFKQTEIGMIPEEWEVKELGLIGTLKNGVNYNRNDIGNGLKVVSVKQLFRGEFVSFNDLGSVKKDSISNYESYLLQEGDLLFARGSLKRDGAGKLALVREIPYKDVVFSGFIIRFRNESKNNYLFLNYLLRSPIYRELFPRIAVGTTITNLNQEILSNVPIILPPLPEQKAIAKILSDLDSKIETLQKQNETLEKMGQLLFKRWFVDFEFPDEDGKGYRSSGGEMVESELGEIPAGWRVDSLDNIANYLNGLALQKYPANKGEPYLPVIKIRELNQGITDNTDKASLKIPKEYIIKNGDILFSWSGSLKVIIWGLGRGALNQHLFKITSKKYEKWFYYYWTLYHLEKFKVIAESKATTMGHIKREHLRESEVLIPDEKILVKMNEVMNPTIEVLINNKVEVEKLVKIRDTLLPKLMSGEVRVKYVQNQQIK